jgi:FAD/FMN-containing dehydrogenase
MALTANSEAREMTIQGGALWGHVYQYLVVEEEGLMVNGSRSPSVGVSGHVLGGGIGPFSRQYGMAVDCLNEITIVTADGEVYVLKPEDDPEKEEGRSLKIIPLLLKTTTRVSSWEHESEAFLSSAITHRTQESRNLC